MIPPNPPDRTPLGANACRALADALGDSPETVIAGHVLRRGFARAHVVGTATRFSAAIVENLAFCPDEPIGFGADPDALWALLRSLRGWSCVNVPPAIAADVGRLVTAATGQPVRYLDDLYHVLDRPAARVRHEAVRLLGPEDARLLEAAPPDVRGAGYRSALELLTEGIAAAAVVAGGVVAIAHTAARSERHADLGVATLPAWRDRGFATAAAALVAERVGAAGQRPVWSTGATNAASVRVARKLGFIEVARRTYVIR